MDNEDLMPELAEKTAQLVRLEHSHDKLRQELSNKEDLLKEKEAELRRRAKQMRTLEEKGHKIDDLEAEVKTLKGKVNQLEQTIREKDFELCQSLGRQQAAEKDVEVAKLAEQRSRDRVAGLTDQLRFEAERAAMLDDRLQDCAEAMEGRQRLLDENRRLTDAANDAQLLTSAARRLQRRVGDELAATKAEVEKLRCLLTELRRLNPELSWPDGWAENCRESSTGTVQQEASEESKSETASQSSAVEFNSSAQKSLDTPTSSFNSSASNVGVKAQLTKSAIANSAVQSSFGSFSSVAQGGGGSDSGLGRRPSRQLRSRLVGLLIHLGDRVTLRLEQQKQQEGIIKYIGQPEEGQKALRFGVKLLNRAAASRQSATAAAAAAHRCDLLVNAKQIESVFNHRTSSYTTLDSLVKDYLDMH